MKKVFVLEEADAENVVGCIKLMQAHLVSLKSDLLEADDEAVVDDLDSAINWADEIREMFAGTE